MSSFLLHAVETDLGLEGAVMKCTDLVSVAAGRVSPQFHFDTVVTLPFVAE